MTVTRVPSPPLSGETVTYGSVELGGGDAPLNSKTALASTLKSVVATSTTSRPGSTAAPLGQLVGTVKVILKLPRRSVVAVAYAWLSAAAIAAPRTMPPRYRSTCVFAGKPPPLATTDVPAPPADGDTST